MRTYTQLVEAYEGSVYWDCDATIGDDERLADVLVYNNEEDLEADTDNSLAIHRETVIDDR
jgi:hypothetical protein